MMENAAALQAISAAVSLPLLLWAGIAARRAAKAAEEQASAARSQVVASRASSKLSEEQLKAALESAAAEREHSVLLEKQLLANLRPALVFYWENGQGMLRNHSATALALNIKINGTGESFRHLDGSPILDLLGPGAHTKIDGVVNESLRLGTHKLIVDYNSDDGRFFETEITLFASGHTKQVSTLSRRQAS